MFKKSLKQGCCWKSSLKNEAK